MKLEISPEFKEICCRIVGENRAAPDWALMESDDMFQAPGYEGGFDATENAFCFSYYSPSGVESWFQISLNEAAAIAAGTMAFVETRPAE